MSREWATEEAHKEETPGRTTTTSVWWVRGGVDRMKRAEKEKKKLKNYFPRIRAAAEPENMMSLTLADFTALFYMRAWDFITDGTRLSFSRVMSRDQRMKLQIKA